jgi:hypothetical protein
MDAEEKRFIWIEYAGAVSAYSLDPGEMPRKAYCYRHERDDALGVFVLHAFFFLLFYFDV